MICGVDEAGRGSLCGSMFIAGVACREVEAMWLCSIGVKDSKKLSRTKRFALAQKLSENTNIHTHIVEKTCTQIDERGLSICLKEAISEIIEHLRVWSDDFYVDGNTLFGLQGGSDYRLSPIIKGDDKIPQIAAASILAKTAKDTQMLALDSLYPQYGFKNNIGYGSREHLKTLALYGYTPHHRKSFTIKNPLNFG
ncbi:hypothetical protein BKH46_04260 [Helicobacter sp. 12S02634-8]|uniref:ribonuclease HII n=1 Tax=Helicobacter sp. 12S02634-8 TaxID=1476199 RepID=UPI000BA6E82D|nr:ribonuclease HII [Helicobacter sp. 12S02634-8]PAF47303.1 hypothetical protein BKH46_04260 [Helicobacter sp. 12S02634-8]